jgi:hypothetical protein
MPLVDPQTNGRPTLAALIARHRAAVDSPASTGEGIDVPTRFSAAALMAMDLPEPKCVVDGILTEGLNLLVSRPKLGKSWWALVVAIAIALGVPALGNVRTTQGDVLYLAMEDNRRRLKRRLAKLLAGTAAPSRLTLATEWPRIGFGGLEQIGEWMDAANEPRLVVVDTFAKVKRIGGPRSGNAYVEDYGEVAELKALADEHGVAVLAVHHVRKMMADDIVDEVSGSIGITAAADTVLILKRDRGQADASLHITGRDIDERELGMKFDPATCRWAVIGDAKALRMSDARRKVLDALRDAGKPMTPTELAKAMKDDPNNVKQFLWQLAQAGDVKSDKGKYTPLTTLTD